MNITKIVALSALFVGALFAVETVKDLTLTSAVGFETEYVSRGKQLADDSIQASIEASYKLANGSLYAGAWTNLPNGTSTTELDLYVGYKQPVYEKYTADVGMTYYWYTESTSAIDRTREIYAGVTYSGLYVNPAVYAYYDIDMEQWMLELSGSYSFDLAKYGVANTTLDLGASVGVLSAEDANSDQVAGSPENGYSFAGVNADVVYSFSKTSSASVGVRYTVNNDDVANDESNFFWGFKFSAGF